MTDIDPAAASARENSRQPSGQFGAQENSIPEATLTDEPNIQRLRREAAITDPSHPGFNSDLDIILPGVTKSYRDLLRAGIDPNDTEAREAFILNELGLNTVPIDERTPDQLVDTMRAEIPKGSTLLFEETDQGGRWLSPIGVRLTDGTRLSILDDDAGIDWDHVEWAASNIRGHEHPDIIETDSYGGYWELPPVTG